MEVKKNIKRILDESYALCFSCLDEDRLYSCWMHYAVIDEKHVLVYSRRDRLHSKLAEKNSNCSVAILPLQNPGYGVRGLSGQGKIRKVTSEEEITSCLKVYQDKFGYNPDHEKQARGDKEDEHCFWVIEIDNYVLFDNHNYEEARNEVKL